MYEKLNAQLRAPKSDAPLRTMRRDGFIPGIIYGKNLEPISFKVKTIDFKKFMSHSVKVFEVTLDGQGTHLVNIDQLQRDNMGNEILHLSLHKLEANQKTIVKVPLVLHGQAPGHKAGGILNQMLNEVDVKGLPKDIPEFIEVDITTLELHGHLCLKDIECPANLEWAHDLDSNIVGCHPPKQEIIEEETIVETTDAGTGPVGDITPADEKEAV